MLQPMQLRTLQEVLLTGSFAEAGARLGFTPSAVSQQIAALERSTGLALFDRGPRSVRPTTAARALSIRVKTMLSELDVLEREIRAMAIGGRGVARVGSFPTASAGLLPAALARLKRSNPGLEVLLDEAEPQELVPRLGAGMLDLVLVYEYDTVPQFWSNEFERTPLLRESLVLLVAASHRAASANAGPVNLANLSDQTWAASRDDTSGARSLERLCASAGFAPKVAYRSNDYNVIRGLVKAGLGVALIPALAHLDDPQTPVVDVVAEGAGRSVFALHRQGDTNPALGAILNALSGAGRAHVSGDRRLWFQRIPQANGTSTLRRHELTAQAR
jgi:DNA-binding transcriptional LysR family regulator